MVRWLKAVLLGVAALVAAQLLVQRPAPTFQPGEVHRPALEVREDERRVRLAPLERCLLYTSDAADEL